MQGQAHPLPVGPVHVWEEEDAAGEECAEHQEAIHFMEHRVLLLVLDEHLPQADEGRAQLCHQHAAQEEISLSLSPQDRHREADGHHEDMVEHHEELLLQVALGEGQCAFGTLMSLHPVLVPVTKEHCVDVVDEVWYSEPCVGGRQPVPVLDNVLAR